MNNKILFAHVSVVKNRPAAKGSKTFRRIIGVQKRKKKVKKVPTDLDLGNTSCTGKYISFRPKLQSIIYFHIWRTYFSVFCPKYICSFIHFDRVYAINIQSVPYIIVLFPSFLRQNTHIKSKNLVFSACKFLYKPYTHLYKWFILFIFSD